VLEFQNEDASSTASKRVYKCSACANGKIAPEMNTHSAIQAHHQQMMKIRFIVPQGVRPGQKILVNSPNGKHISVVIPRMAQPGSSITVMVPAGIPSPTKLNGDNSITNPMLNSGPSTNTSSNE
jgi:hypothetical protein